MTTQMGVLLELVEAVETNMETICTLAINIKVPKDLIINLSVAKLSIVESKIYLTKHIADRFTIIDSTSMETNADKDSKIKIQQIPELLELPIDPGDIKNEVYILDPKQDTKAGIRNNLEPSLLEQASSINDLLQSSEVFCKYEFDNNFQIPSVSVQDDGDAMEVMEDETILDDPDYNGDDLNDMKGETSSEDEFLDASKYSDSKKKEGKKEKKERIKLCEVCNSPACSWNLNGVVSCRGCQDFFRKWHKKAKPTCISNTDECEITEETRNRCKSCRYNKCIEVGMDPEKPPKETNKDSEKKIEENPSLRKCQVCNRTAPAIRYLYYGVVTCRGCQHFFLKWHKRGKPTCISKTDECVINERTYKKCRSCRYNKCIEVGIDPSKPSINTNKENSMSSSDACQICGSPAILKFRNYGAKGCASCVSFFRRCSGERAGNLTCINNTDDCEITEESKNVCKRCRWNKCIQVGMKPEKVKDNNGECTVCGDETEVHKYMGAVSCYVCSAFFAYTDPEKRCEYGDCEITKLTRHYCQYCRFKKCLSVGMKLGLRKTIKKPNPDVVSEIVEKVKSEGKLSEDKFDDNKDSIGNKAETAEFDNEPNQIKAKRLIEFTNTFPQRRGIYTYDGILNALDTGNYNYFMITRKSFFKNALYGEFSTGCGICTLRNFEAHQIEHHMKMHFRKGACKTCEQPLFSFERRNHNKRNHFKKCRNCKQLWYDMEKHKKVCRGIENPLKCEECGKMCKSKLSLDTHIICMHKNKETVVCDTCGEFFSGPRKLKLHMRSNHPGVFHCNICSQILQTLKELNAHKKEKHLESHGKFCEECGKKFMNLKKHNLCHIKKECCYCMKMYSASKLWGHIQLVHEQSLVVWCNICNKQFTHDRNVGRHLRDVHKIEITHKEVLEKMKKGEIKSKKYEVKQQQPDDDGLEMMK